MTQVRCRFAPAPSGAIHVGNARTALYSWLTARHHGGAFVLRVEDTDASRVSEEAFHLVMESLRWLGIEWDEGPDVGGPHAPYRQSERMDIYREHADRLVADARAYRCYCTPDELEQRRQEARARGEPPGYDGRCRTRTREEIAGFEAEDRPWALRFWMPEREFVVEDLLKGEVRFAPGSLRDFVLMRSDGTPTYLLATGTDDMLMGMTHIIRGEDLLASTPRQLALMEALGATTFPAYAHHPMIVGADRQPLSKRHGSTSVEAFRERGFLPEALVNYLALLGWSWGEQDFLTTGELVERFDISRVSRNPAMFDTQKLEWMNNHYIQGLEDDELAARCLHFLTAAGLSPEPVLLRRAMPLVKERMKTLTDSVELLRFLFTDDVVPNEKAAQVLAKAPEGYVPAAAAALQAVEPWTADAIGAALDALAEGAGLNRTKGWQPVRAAVTGSNVSPPLPESLELLGREQTVARLRAA
ncbi:MAG TPA: glutamate--tRNA ligase [Actinomycetota bacterium]|nr:glutamate--tRNA ligase [Actinomycetota bacterium]